MNKSITKKQLDNMVHEVGQLLTVAINYVEGCIRYLKRENTSKEIIEALTEAVNEIELSRKLLRNYRDDYLKSQNG